MTAPTAIGQRTANVNTARIVVLIAASVAGAAAFLPWIKATVGFGSIEANGIDGDGKVTLVIAALVVLLALGRFYRTALVPTVALFAASAYELVHVTNRVNAYNADGASFGRLSVGVGLYVLLVAAVVATLALVVLVMAREGDA